jgi:hypothetical protein
MGSGTFDRPHIGLQPRKIAGLSPTREATNRWLN